MNAAGTEPTDNQRTSVQLTVRRLMCTPPPIGFSTNDATTSEEMAADGVMWNKMTSIGVIKAPPPIPVSPITKPTTTPAAAISHCTGGLPISTKPIDNIDQLGMADNGPESAECGSRRRRTMRCGRRWSSRPPRAPGSRSKGSSWPGARAFRRTSSRTSSPSCAGRESCAPGGGPRADTSSHSRRPRSPWPTCCGPSKDRWRRCREFARTSSSTREPRQRFPRYGSHCARRYAMCSNTSRWPTSRSGKLPPAVKQRTRVKDAWRKH